MAERRRIKFLVVEDEPDIIDLLTELLADEGYSSVSVMRGEEAVKKASEETFQVVLMDLKLPDIDGVEVSRRIKKIRPEVSIMVITAYSYGELADRAEASDLFDKIMYKPFDLNELKREIRKLLREKGLYSDHHHHHHRKNPYRKSRP
jgi:DNA-binding response OmpR family regulator